MYRVLTSEKDLRVERVIYRLAGVDPRADQRWTVYAASDGRLLLRGRGGAVRASSASRPTCPSSLGFPGVDPALAFNTAASFVTNTNWQAYSGEATMGHLTQMAGLAVQNFVSAAVGIAVAVALIRGITRSRTDRIGNFWVDLVRISVRILLPLAVVAAVALIAMGAIQNFSSGTDVDHARRRRTRRSPAGRWPPRRSSRSSAPTAAASTTPTPRTRSRTRTR